MNPGRYLFFESTSSSIRVSSSKLVLFQQGCQFQTLCPQQLEHLRVAVRRRPVAMRCGGGGFQTGIAPFCQKELHTFRLSGEAHA